MEVFLSFPSSPPSSEASDRSVTKADSPGNSDEKNHGVGEVKLSC